MAFDFILNPTGKETAVRNVRSDNELLQEAMAPNERTKKEDAEVCGLDRRTSRLAGCSQGQHTCSCVVALLMMEQMLHSTSILPCRGLPVKNALQTRRDSFFTTKQPPGLISLHPNLIEFLV